MVDKAAGAYRMIGEVAALIDEPAHVIRFWESRIAQLKPGLRSGGRRRYRPEDVRLMQAVRILVRERGVTLDGVSAMLKEGGRDAVYAVAEGRWAAPPKPPPAGGYRRGKLIEELEAARARLAPFI